MDWYKFVPLQLVIEWNELSNLQCQLLCRFFQILAPQGAPDSRTLVLYRGYEITFWFAYFLFESTFSSSVLT